MAGMLNLKYNLQDKAAIYHVTSAWQQRTRIHFVCKSATILSISCEVGIECLCLTGSNACLVFTEC